MQYALDDAHRAAVSILSWGFWDLVNPQPRCLGHMPVGSHELEGLGLMSHELSKKAVYNKANTPLMFLKV